MLEQEIREQFTRYSLPSDVKDYMKYMDDNLVRFVQDRHSEVKCKAMKLCTLDSNATMTVPMLEWQQMPNYPCNTSSFMTIIRILQITYKK